MRRALWYKDGYHIQDNIDVSSTVIDQMQKRHAAEMPEATWQVMDARQLAFADGQFDAIVDQELPKGMIIRGQR